MIYEESSCKIINRVLAIAAVICIFEVIDQNFKVALSRLPSVASNQQLLLTDSGAS